MEFLEFSFQSFWHFIGVTLMMGMICRTVVKVTMLICGRFAIKKEENKDE